MLLKEIATVKGGKRLPKSDSLVSEKTDHPYIRIRDMYQSYPLELNDDFEYITSETYEKIKKYTVEQGDVIIAVVGNTIGLVSVIGESLHGANLTENCNKIVDIHNYEGRFLYYFLTSAIGQNEIKKGIVGSSQPKLPIYNIEKLQLPDFPLKEQTRIVEVLESIDKKINNNEKINENLEQQAQTIFNDLFPDVFSLNTDATLQDLIIFANGKKRPKTIGNIPVYGGNGILAYTDKSNADNCVIIGRVGAYCGNTFLCLDKCWTSDNAIQAKSRTNSSPLFIYYLLRNASLSSRHIGTGQPLMTQGILNAIPIKHPAEEKISAFIEICTPVHKMIAANKKQNESLASMRNSLLPKLMSGEIDISVLDI